MGQYDAKLMKIYDKRTTLPHLLYQKRAEKRRYAISRPQVIGIIRYHVGTHVHYHSGARKDIHQARSSPSRRAQKQFRNRPFLSILIQYSFNTHSIPFKASLVDRATTPNWSTRDAYLTIRTAKGFNSPAPHKFYSGE